MENVEPRTDAAAAEVNGTAIQRSAERRDRAQRILDSGNTPHVLWGIGFALAGALIANLALHGSEIPDLVRGFLVPMSGVVLSLLYACFRLRQHLDAAVELLSIREPPACHSAAADVMPGPHAA